MLFPFFGLARRYAMLSLLFCLCGCVLAPGMKFNARALPGQPVNVVELDPSSVAQLDALNEQVLAKRCETDRLAGVSEPYRIGPADVVSIIVWDHPELVIPNLTYDIGTTGSAQSQSVGMTSQRLPGYVVSDDGILQFPYVKRFRIGGLTEIEAQQRLEAELEPYIHDPQISLRVIGYRSKKIYVNGEVREPGVKPITDVPMTLAQALHEADGVLSTGDASRMLLMRNGHRYSICLPEYTARGLEAGRIPLLDGDVVRVPPQSDFNVFVLGEVQRPGAVKFRSDGRLTLSQALGMAQPSQETSDPSQIYLVRPPENVRELRDVRNDPHARSRPVNAEVYHLNAKSPQGFALAQQIELRPDDVVYIDAPGIVRWNRVIAQILGGTTAAYNVQNAATRGWW
ncbi:polysaccharide biosynthesis/export family protein [Burkholderia stagnalis]|uniref:Sugar transporter n=1 Tax=Burkholderia stagnalis TaxID=1503054 RepID=A0ABX9YCY9_9BURK|nr:polysaccharide biosynthesis/export family protein [Burkholderia stagnalis]RQQ47556.1 sugar transporter [Burkholderia stagnalis]RQQ59045.1 sugar transporter [Burkholderia stagnalis]RQQ59580.1 sugar transporter [Burkholderia stagnalis]RQQ73879.1 sugar transporter [Burkholderia stagnalis]RQQ79665.1 sugar transporter [Burkholderia stagnalis]